MDNAPVHKAATLKYRGVKIVFMPPNCSCLLQPMDQTVIKAFKSYYIRNVMFEAFVKVDKGETTLAKYLKEFKIDSCIRHVAKAWDEVSVGTMHRSWKQLLPGMFETEEAADDKEGDEDDDDDELDRVLIGRDVEEKAQFDHILEHVDVDDVVDIYSLTDQEKEMIIEQKEITNEGNNLDKVQEVEIEDAREDTVKSLVVDENGDESLTDYGDDDDNDASMANDDKSTIDANSFLQDHDYSNVPNIYGIPTERINRLSKQEKKNLIQYILATI